MQIRHYETKPSKYIEFVLCWSSEHGAYLSVRFVISSETTLEKINFSFVSGCQLEIVSGFRLGACVHCSVSAVELHLA